MTFPNTSGSDSPAVAAVDLDNDGKLDVVIAHEMACYGAVRRLGGDLRHDRQRRRHVPTLA